MNESQHSNETIILPFSGKKDMLEIDYRPSSEGEAFEFWSPISGMVEVDFIPIDPNDSPFLIEVSPDKARDVMDHVMAYSGRVYVDEEFEVAA